MDITLKSIAKNIATLGPIGYLPAPGTCASLVTLLVAWFLEPLLTNYTTISDSMICYILMIVAYWAVRMCLEDFEHKDPSQIVIDEVLGMSCCLLYIPHTIFYYATAFILFRFFDIYKPWPIYLVENVGYEQGILGDDMVAALMTWTILNVIIGLS